MIESLMLCGIGLLAGCLLMLLFFPAVHRRAVRLTRRDLVDATPLTAHWTECSIVVARLGIVLRLFRDWHSGLGNAYWI